MARNLPPDPKAQRTALKNWSMRFGDTNEFALQFDVNQRQVERFFAGTHALSPGLCRDIAGYCRDGSAHLLADIFTELATAHTATRTNSGPQGRKRDRAPEPMRGKPSGADAPRPALEGPQHA